MRIHRERSSAGAAGGRALSKLKRARLTYICVKIIFTISIKITFT